MATICPVPDCPAITDGGRCPAHRQRSRASHDATTTSHRKARARVARQVATGTVPCARCGHLIQPDDDWHLDHTDDRSDYLGPSHAYCNTAAGGRAAHRGGGTS